MREQVFYQSPLGGLILEASEKALFCIKFAENFDHKIPEKTENKILLKTLEQLHEYFFDKRMMFDIPLNSQGTDFQKKVWKALSKIPYGTTVSYKHIAIDIGNEKAVRAVGGANNKNPIPILIPCHRVLGMRGDLVGYAGGVESKKKLLELEGCNYK